MCLCNIGDVRKECLPGVQMKQSCTGDEGEGWNLHRIFRGSTLKGAWAKSPEGGEGVTRVDV